MLGITYSISFYVPYVSFQPVLVFYLCQLHLWPVRHLTVLSRQPSYIFLSGSWVLYRVCKCLLPLYSYKKYFLPVLVILDFPQSFSNLFHLQRICLYSVRQGAKISFTAYVCPLSQYPYRRCHFPINQKSHLYWMLKLPAVNILEIMWKHIK